MHGRPDWRRASPAIRAPPSSATSSPTPSTPTATSCSRDSAANAGGAPGRARPSLAPLPGQLRGVLAGGHRAADLGAGFDAPVLRDGYWEPAERSVVASAGWFVGFGGAGVSVDTEQATAQFASDGTAFLGLMSGTPSATSGLPITLEFSQFERDDMDRWMTAVRLQWANRVLADVYAVAGGPRRPVAIGRRPRRRRRRPADRLGPPGASLAARAAYRDVVAAAEVLRIRIEPWNGRQDQGAEGYAARARIRWWARPREPWPRPRRSAAPTAPWSTRWPWRWPAPIRRTYRPPRCSPRSPEWGHRLGAAGASGRGSRAAGGW